MRRNGWERRDGERDGKRKGRLGNGANGRKYFNSKAAE